MTIDKAQLKALAWYTEDHLTDRSATTYNAHLAAIWAGKGWPVNPLFDDRQVDNLLAEIDKLRAELAGLRTGYEAQNEVIAGLRKDAERYNWAICRVQCAEALSAVVICHDGYKDKINERVDAYMEAWPCPVAAMAKESSHG
ncbi:hypothetical protein [Pseudomonas putida]|uniref:Uncharacterized protein n=1 Tax=Pseudomonas putida TaxID=303 RepID=A0A177SAU1_PSEPU|nr:hypothetical protein [Pseudomonas putida]OAI84894.1 hypothetical protein AYO28_03155 [Pseudomonas putida]